MFTWWRRRKEAQSYREALEPLEERVRLLELANAERQLTVLNTVEKVMNQLRARVKKREPEKSLEDAPGPTNDDEPVPQYPPPTGVTQRDLARRFRRF